MNIIKVILPLLFLSLSNASNLEEVNDEDFFFLFRIENKVLHTTLINNTGEDLFISSEIYQLDVNDTFLIIIIYFGVLLEVKICCYINV